MCEKYYAGNTVKKNKTDLYYSMREADNKQIDEQGACK